MPEEREWDSESNGPEPAEEPATIGLGNIAIGGTSYIPASGMWSTTATVINDAHTYGLHISSPENYFESGTLHLNSQQTVVSPGSINARTQYITPIEFSYHNVSWKYAFALAFSIAFAPLFILWSKLTGRPTGIRLRNRIMESAVSVTSTATGGIV
jgi:hypothetical protein